jgi:hypothetical protein
MLSLAAALRSLLRDAARRRARSARSFTSSPARPRDASRAATRSVRLLVFFALLALVTVRGLHGSPPASATLFWPLVLVYGAALDRVLARFVDAAQLARPLSPPLS